MSPTTVTILKSLLHRKVRRGTAFEKTKANVLSSFSPEMASKAKSKVIKLRNMETINAQLKLSPLLNKGLLLSWRTE